MKFMKVYCILFTVMIFALSVKAQPIGGLPDPEFQQVNFLRMAEPQMPQIACRAHIEGVPLEEQEDLQFNWTIEIIYDEWTLERSGNIIGINDWIPEFGSEFGGGNVVLSVKVEYESEYLEIYYGIEKNILVLGTNPEDNVVLSYISSISADPDIVQCTRGCARMETSGFSQFKSTGFPNKSGDRGFGIMQLTGGVEFGRQEVWNWKNNIDTGASYIGIIKTDATWYFGTVPGYIPDEEHLHKDMYRRYNAGIPYYDRIGHEPWFIRDATYADDCGLNDCSPRLEHKANDPHGECFNSGCCYADMAYDLEDN